MKRKFLHIAVLGCLVLLSPGIASAASRAKRPEGLITDVFYVYRADRFSGKVKGLEGVPDIRVRVQIRDIEPAEEQTRQAAKAFTKDTLENAERIELRNVHIRNFFRIEADVYADGVNLADMLIEKNFAQSTAQPELETSSAPRRWRRRFQEIDPAQATESAQTGEAARSVARRSPYLQPRPDRGGRKVIAVNADSMIRNMLEQKIDVSIFNADMRFDEALEVLRETTNPNLPITVLWGNLESAFVFRETPIGISGSGRIPARQWLRLMLRSVAGGYEDIEYFVQGGTITIATRDIEIGGRTNGVYNVADLFGAPADFYAEPNGSQGSSGSSGFGSSSGRSSGTGSTGSRY